MFAAARRLRQRLGLRGVFLLLMGSGETCLGVSFIVDPPNTRGLELLTDLCSLHHWAWLWITAGVITTVSAFLQIGRDLAGLLAALTPPTVWATAYTYAAVTGTYSRGGYIAIWYLTSHVGVILWAATVPEYSVPHLPRSARKGKAP